MGKVIVAAITAILSVGLGGTSGAALAPENAEEQICKKMPPPLGTRAGSRRICKTKAEWAALDDQQRDAIERALGKPCNQEPTGTGMTDCGGTFGLGGNRATMLDKYKGFGN